MSARARDANQENEDADALVFHGGVGACEALPLACPPHVHADDGHHECADGRAP